MGMVYCAECGTKISEYADACPHCGFKGNKSTALAVREKLAIQSRAWADASLTEEFDSVLPISFVQKTRFESLFTNAETLVTVAPALYNAVKEMIPDAVVAAKIPGEVQKLLDQGVVKFVTDKNGEILPTIFRDGKMFKQVRLEELKTTPELGRAVVDLQQQAALAEILHEIREVHEAVKEVTTSLHNDRLARVNAALQQLQQASLITDSRLREAKLLDITSRATEAKEMLMYSFVEGMDFFSSRSGEKNLISMIMDTKAQKEADKRSRVQFQTLAALTRAVQVEATAYCLVDEREAARESLRQFSDFIENNRLNDRNTLVMLSQFNTANQGKLIHGFVELQKRISAFSVPEDELIALPKDSWTDTEKDDINGTDL